jgi:hypothetical protein
MQGFWHHETLLAGGIHRWWSMTLRHEIHFCNIYSLQLWLTFVHPVARFSINITLHSRPDGTGVV